MDCEQVLAMLSMMPNPQTIAENNKIILKQLFKDKIKGHFLISVEERVLKELGFEKFMKYYDFRWSDERMITGLEEAAQYDICRMIVGIHRAHSIFVTKDEIRKNERDENYKQRIISEIIEKIELRPYGSLYFRKKTLLQGEEFLYYPLPYEIFVMCVKMSEVLNNSTETKCWQLYYGIVYNGISALSLMEDNLLGSAYLLCRGAIEMYVKFLMLNVQPDLYKSYEKFREFEVEQSCRRQYPESFLVLFDKRICSSSKNKVDYLHYGWVDFTDGYHNVIKKSPYSIYGIITFLKNKENGRIAELEQLENLYKSCHAYIHGSIQVAKYPVLHYFEISIMLYYIIRNTFLLLCKKKGIESTINGLDVISMMDRDYKVLYEQYCIRSTEKFEEYYKQ